MADTPISRMVYPFGNDPRQTLKQFVYSPGNSQHLCHPYQPGSDTHVALQHRYDMKSRSPEYGGSDENHETHHQRYTTLDSSAGSGRMMKHDSPSTQSSFPTGSGSPAVSQQEDQLLSSEPEEWVHTMSMPRGNNLKQLLITCARAVEEKDNFAINLMIPELRKMVSVSGAPLERLGAYMVEGLVARLASSGTSIYKALKCREPKGSELLSYMHFLYEACPYFKFGYMSANGAIAEAVKGEDMIHIIDFQIGQGAQWISLIHALAVRPGGPPFVRITGIDDSFSAYARGGGLELVGKRLAHVACMCKVPFEFHAVAVSGTDIEAEHLDVVIPGEAVAVNFTLELHHVPDETVSTANHRDRILRLVKSLSPRVLTLVEQESNTNTAAFAQRFAETLDYYAAVFESVDLAMPARDDPERINVEQHCLAREVVNLVACEGDERVERHELFGKWKARMTMAGFRASPLSSVVNATIETLLQSYSHNYKLLERDGALYLGWKNRPLVVSSAWH